MPHSGGRFAGKTCVLCRSEKSSPAGEHAIPRWYLNERKTGVFTTGRNGTLLETRAGNAHTTSSAHGVHVPMCRTCNGKLNTRFELPTKAIIRRLRDDPHCRLDATETRAATLWLIKVTLLLSHSEARWDNDLIDREWRTRSDIDDADADEAQNRTFFEPWSQMPKRLIDWMLDPTGEPPADELSLYAMFEDRSLPSPPDPERVYVPGAEATAFGIGPVVRTSLIHHDPSIRPTHPYVATGQAIQLWPAKPGVALDLTAIAPTASRSFTWLS